MNTLDILLAFANILYAGAMYIRDVLWLRILLFVSGAVLIAWGYIKDEYIFITWSFFFLIINGYRIACIINERRDVELGDKLETIYQEIFFDLSRREFLNFWNFGVERELAVGELICHENTVPDDLVLIIDGSVGVYSKDREVAKLGTLQFVAEMSFLTENPATANVRVEEPVKILAWSQKKLRDLKQIDPGLFGNLLIILGRDLSGKLTRRL